MIVIFVMSSFGSTQSDNQSNFIVDIIVNILNVENVDVLSFIVRKTAHCVEYLILGILVYNMFKSYDKKEFFAIIVCMLYAISDEVHQSFVPGRSCQISDILIDGIGSFIGILCYKIFIKFKNIVNKW